MARISNGFGLSAVPKFAVVMGYNTIASAPYSTATGNGTIAASDNSIAMGTYNQGISGASLMVGNGTAATNRSNALTVLKSGYIGIGTTTPLAPLHIAVTQLLNYVNPVHFSTTAFYYLKDLITPSGGSVSLGMTGLVNGSIVNSTNGGNVGLLVEKDIVSKGEIVAVQTVTTSDARIKTILGATDPQRDLQTLRRLAVTNYTYKDVVRLGHTSQKKVIAQQVETVYPQAVQQRTDFIPDLYTLAIVQAIPTELTLPVSHSLYVGETIKLINARKGDLVETVTRVIDPKTFVVSAAQTGAAEKLFVYGRQVADFRVVDYEALSVLNISATQALLQRLERLEAENVWLKVGEKSVLSQLQTIVSRLNQREADLNTPRYSGRWGQPRTHVITSAPIQKLYATRRDAL